MFSQRIQAQFQQFQAFVASLNIERDENLGENEDQKNGEELTRDQFDLRKIIVVVTASGKLFGLDTIGNNVTSSDMIVCTIFFQMSVVEIITFLTLLFI